MKKRHKEIRIEYELTDLPITALGGLPVVREAAKARFFFIFNALSGLPWQSVS